MREERSEMAEIIIRQLLIGPYEVFTYVVACQRTKEGVIIDPAGEEERIMDLIQGEGIRIKYILNTHGHHDHIRGNQKLSKALGAPVCLHEEEARFFSEENLLRFSKLEEFERPVSASMLLKDGDRIPVGDLDIEVIHTPGHTPGAVCYLVEGNLFTGDTLFVGSAGRTDLAGGSLDRLIESLEKRIITLPDDTIIWPGHHYGDTPYSTIKREKEENVYITDFILED